jgi:hypothetical protein
MKQLMRLMRLYAAIQLYSTCSYGYTIYGIQLCIAWLAAMRYAAIRLMHYTAIQLYVQLFGYAAYHVGSAVYNIY